MNDVTAINVFVEIDGKQCIALIDPEKSMLFMGMLAAFQSEASNKATLTALPECVVTPLLDTRRAFQKYVREIKEAGR